MDHPRLLTATVALLLLYLGPTTTAAAQHPVLQQPSAQNLSPLNCGRGHHLLPCPKPPPPPPPPVTATISFDPPNPTITGDAPIGTFLANIIVVTSNGQPFTGSFGFAPPYGSDGGFCVIVGRTVILGVIPPPPSTQVCTITANLTQ